VLALDIGGTSIAAALVGPGGIDEVATLATPAAAGPEAVIAAALEVSEQVRGKPRLRAVGIASAGVIDTDRGRVTHATGSLTAWAGTDLAGPFAERFGVPVAVLNDVHAHGLGEARSGVGAGRSSMLLMAVGTGIGGCHVRDGEVILGARGAAGHIGHLPVPEAQGVPCPCGRSGHLEGLASGPGIVRLAARLGARDQHGRTPADGHALARAAAAGDDAAAEAYRIAGFATGRAGLLGVRASAPGIARRAPRRAARARQGRPAAAGPPLARAAAAGDDAAAEAYRFAGFAPGRVVGVVLNVLDAEVVALTGGVTEAESPWRTALDAGLAHDAMDVVAETPMLPARAGSHAALLG